MQEKIENKKTRKLFRIFRKIDGNVKTTKFALSLILFSHCIAYILDKNI